MSERVKEGNSASLILSLHSPQHLFFHNFLSLSLSLSKITIKQRSVLSKFDVQKKLLSIHSFALAEYCLLGYP